MSIATAKPYCLPVIHTDQGSCLNTCMLCLPPLLWVWEVPVANFSKVTDNFLRTFWHTTSIEFKWVNTEKLHLFNIWLECIPDFNPSFRPRQYLWELSNPQKMHKCLSCLNAYTLISQLVLIYTSLNLNKFSFMWKLSTYFYNSFTISVSVTLAWCKNLVVNSHAQFVCFFPYQNISIFICLFLVFGLILGISWDCTIFGGCWKKCLMEQLAHGNKCCFVWHHNGPQEQSSDFLKVQKHTVSFPGK